jgi:hypothetical protein
MAYLSYSAPKSHAPHMPRSIHRFGIRDLNARASGDGVRSGRGPGFDTDFRALSLPVPLDRRGRALQVLISSDPFPEELV